MSDHQIRQILIEERREELRLERRAEVIDAIETFIAFGGLMFIGFMLSVIGG